MPKNKDRLDVLLVERGLVESRARARAYIMAGEVSVNGVRVDKAGTQVPLDAQIELATPMPYVGRGDTSLPVLWTRSAFRLKVSSPPM